ncbi:MAG: hypothetical protein AAGI15_12710 [Pseudomonadota bacterium]
MAGALLAAVLAAIVGSLAWLALGVRFRFAPAERANQWLNLLAYGLLALPFTVLAVFALSGV